MDVASMYVKYRDRKSSYHYVRLSILDTLLTSSKRNVIIT